VGQLRGALDHQFLHLRIRNAGEAGIRHQGARKATVEVFEKAVSEYVGTIRGLIYACHVTYYMRHMNKRRVR